MLLGTQVENLCYLAHRLKICATGETQAASLCYERAKPPGNAKRHRACHAMAFASSGDTSSDQRPLWYWPCGFAAPFRQVALFDSRVRWTELPRVEGLTE